MSPTAFHDGILAGLILGRSCLGKHSCYELANNRRFPHDSNKMPWAFRKLYTKRQEFFRADLRCAQKMAAHLTVILPLHKRAHHALKFSITVCTRVLGKTIDNVSFLAVFIILSGPIELPRREKLCPATRVIFPAIGFYHFVMTQLLW